MSEEDKPLVRRGSELPELTENEEYNPLDYLSPRAQKIAQQKVLSNLSDDQIMKRHGLSKRAYNKILKSEHFQTYLKQCQRQLHDEDFFTKAKAQEMFLRQKIFEELETRFDAPDPDQDLGPNATMEERAEYMKRFAFNANFKDLMKVWEGVDKRTRLNAGEATDRVSNDELVHGVQERFTRLTARRRKLQEMLGEPEVVKVEAEQPDGSYQEIEVEVERPRQQKEDEYEEEIVMEEYSITKKR